MEKKKTVGIERISSLFDDGSFVEIGAYVKSTADDTEYDGVLCGYGSVNGKLTFAFVQDMDRMHGAMDTSGSKKIAMIYEMAMKNGAPILGVFDSAGAVIYDGSATLSAYGSWLKCVSDASGIIPQIAIVSGVCAGLAAVATTMFDFVLTVKDKSQIYVTSPVATKVKPTAQGAMEAGVAAANYDNEKAAMAGARKLIDLLPLNNRDKSLSAPDDLNKLLPDDPSYPYDILDNGEFFELYADYAPQMKVGFGRLGGELVGLVFAKGLLNAQSARKAKHLVDFCDAFGITVLTLVDSDGFDTVQMDAISSFGTLATAYASATCPKVTAIIGHAYGAAFTLLGSRSLGADVVFATDGSVISTLSPEKAVAFVWNDKITNEKSRADVENEWIEAYAKPEIAARNGDIDDVISTSELRMRLCSAVYMLSGKADGIPSRHHPVGSL